MADSSRDKLHPGGHVAGRGALLMSQCIMEQRKGDGGILPFTLFFAQSEVPGHELIHLTFKKGLFSAIKPL